MDMGVRGVSRKTVVGIVLVALIGGLAYIYMGRGEEALATGPMLLLENKAEGYRDYQVNRDNAYSQGEAVYVYVEIKGLTTQTEMVEEEGMVRVWLSYTFTVRKDGEVLKRKTEGKSPFLIEKDRVGKLFLQEMFSTDELSPGTYAIEWKIVDKLASGRDKVVKKAKAIILKSKEGSN